MSISTVQAKLNEHVVLKKFNGDGPENRTDEPEEVIELHNGVVVKRTVCGVEIPLE